ncbi:MAG: hypothetical protein JXR83_21825 [Deltaproteobacteria bacterium]|nr:hypothetical protein [Deltaproteobacteria bacterium]
MTIAAAVVACACHLFSLQIPAPPIAAEPAETEAASPLVSGGLATGAAGLAVLAVGLAGFAYQAFVVQPSMQQLVVATRDDDGRSIVVVTDDHAYRKLLDLSRCLFWVATALSAVGGTLTAVGGSVTGFSLLTTAASAE